MITIPFIYFLILTIYLIKKNRGVDISAFVTMIYALSALCSIIAHIKGLYGEGGICEEMEISPFATFVYCALITLSIIPFAYLKSTSLHDIYLDPKKEYIIDVLSWVLILVSLISIIYIFNDVNQVFHSDLKEVRDDVYDHSEGKSYTGVEWLINFIRLFFNQYSPLSILLFFYNIRYNRKTKLFNYLLLFASLIPVFASILIAGRTQPVYWLLTFMLIYNLFRPLLNKKQRATAIRPFAFFGGIILLWISAITIARFASGVASDEEDTWASVIAYTGQSFINFNDFFCNYTAHDLNFCRIFPLSYHFFIDRNWNLWEYRDEIWSYSGMNIGVFYTFLGDLLVDLGHTGMFIYVSIFSFISIMICKDANKNGIATLGKLMLIIMLILLPLHGLFYFSYWKIVNSYYVIGTVILYIMLNYSVKIKK